MTNVAVKKVVEIASQVLEGTDDGDSSAQDCPPKNQASIPLEELCRLLDELMEEVGRETNGVGNIQVARFHETSSEESESGHFGLEPLTIQADCIRAILGLSLHLLHRISRSQSKLGPIIQHLEQSYRQSKLLLGILSVSFAFVPEGHGDSPELPSYFPALQAWIELEKQHSLELINGDANEGSTLISFDKEELAMEEGLLLQMAATPTPAEVNRGSTEQWNSQPLLVARMPSTYLQVQSDQSSVQVTMDHRGVIRLRDHALSSNWWAALTANSTTHYTSPNFTITSVVIPPFIASKNTNDDFSLSAITLQVGRDGHKWWELSSVIIQMLGELQHMQDAELNSLWPKDLVENRISEVRDRIRNQKTTTALG